MTLFKGDGGIAPSFPVLDIGTIECLHVENWSCEKRIVGDSVKAPVSLSHEDRPFAKNSDSCVSDTRRSSGASSTHLYL